MTTNKSGAKDHSIGEEAFPIQINEWIKQRRQQLDLTQEQLAKRTRCSVFAIRKIELGERRPSRQLAELLAQSLEIPPEDQNTFIQVARGELRVERLPSPFHISRSCEKTAPPPVNLPRQLTPFIGRESELGMLAQLLQDPQCSLITIIGQGGIGKTRLAVEAAQHASHLFPDGAWFVPLAALHAPGLIVYAIAEALNIKLQDHSNPQAQLLRYLRSKRALLILDNAEHLLEEVGVFTEILQDCRQVKLLVTSLERLNLLSEWVFEIRGLPVPPDDPVEQLESYSSIALFLQSARRVRAGFEIQAAERKWVLEICQLLEGLPLGIELAAAWVGLLSCEEIAREIARNLDFLTVSVRDLPERHRSLRATLNHSWNLLNPEEKLILSRLTVFRGSFNREAAQEICGASLAILSSLRDKTLLYRTDQDFYSLHEFIRQYATLKLRENPGEEERVKDQHAAYYVRCLAGWEKKLKSSQQLETLNEMAPMINNLREGWRWMLVNGQFDYLKSGPYDARLFHNSSFSLSFFYEMYLRSWEAVDLFTEVVEFLKTAHAAFERSEESCRFNAVLGTISAYLGLHQLTIYQHAKARENLEEAIHLLENNQSRLERAQAQTILGWIYFQQGKMQRATELMEQSLACYQEERNIWWYMASSVHLAQVYLFSGNLSACEALCQEVFRLAAPGDIRVEVPIKRVNAYLYYFKNDYGKAEQLMQVNLQLAYQFKNHRGLIANRLIDLCQVALATNRIDVAEKYVQECIDLVSEYGESYELAFATLYLGKCFVARSEVEAGRDKFRQVIRMGQTFDAFYLIYWGMVNIARTYMVEGQTEKALEIFLVLRDCPVEYKQAKDEGDRLLADLLIALPEWQVFPAMQPVGSKVSPDQAIAKAQEYVLGFEYA